jgi:uroporphyrinogen-III synthase
MLAPVLRIEITDKADLGSPPWAGILLTSSNAARAIAGHRSCRALMYLPVMAVGQASAQAAREAGFTNVSFSTGDVSDLARLVAARFTDTRAPLLYLAGADRAGNLDTVISSRGIQVRTVIVYRAVKVEEWPPATWIALDQGRIEGVLHFSRRSAEAYLACSRDILQVSLQPIHYCISERTAEPLRRAGASKVHVATKPDEASLLDLLR